MATSLQVIVEMKERRNTIESHIKELNSVLESQKNIGMKESLVDADGYPRSDIDIHTVRHARHDIICLQNDHKEIMSQIENQLYKIHAEAREQKQEVEPQASFTEQSESVVRKPFARIERVDPTSPSETAVISGDECIAGGTPGRTERPLPCIDQGLEVEDLVLQFGSINLENFQSLQSIATVVQHCQGRPLSVTVLRKGKQIRLSLTPQTWSGRGLLGCNIVPVKT